jgi:hypothetical protein
MRLNQGVVAVLASLFPVQSEAKPATGCGEASRPARIQEVGV